MIFPGTKGHVLLDLGSGIGTFLNGQRIRQAALSHGDRLQVGPVTLRYSMGALAGEASRTSVSAEAPDCKRRLDPVMAPSAGFAKALPQALQPLPAARSERSPLVARPVESAVIARSALVQSTVEAWKQDTVFGEVVCAQISNQPAQSPNKKNENPSGIAAKIGPRLPIKPLGRHSMGQRGAAESMTGENAEKKTRLQETLCGSPKTKAAAWGSLAAAVADVSLMARGSRSRASQGAQLPIEPLQPEAKLFPRRPLAVAVISLAIIALVLAGGTGWTLHHFRVW